MINRRNFMVGMATTLTVLTFGAGELQAAPLTISAKDARAKVQAGELILMDIRTRQEWQQTGVGDVVLQNSMHEKGFLQRLDKIMKNDKSAAIGLICATGGRSNWLQGELAKRGYTNVYDVSEGMMGSKAGAGWLKQGLPTKKAE